MTGNGSDNANANANANTQADAQGALQEPAQQLLSERTRRLQYESHRQLADNRALRADIVRLERDRQRLTHLLDQAAHLLHSLEAGIESLQHSIALQLGYTITQSLRSLRGMLALPLRVIRLLRASRHGGRTGSVVAVPLPHEWFPTSLRLELAKFQSDFMKDGATQDDVTRPIGNDRVLPRPDHVPLVLDATRIAAIMDEFTFSALRECCAVTQLTAEAWREELPRIKPHLLFIESAWDGKDSSWLRKVSGASQELRQLVAHCRKNAIPVVFWSKEDPVHFKTFIAAARLADVVFTTDIDCIQHYKSALGHDRVFLLPFATQPVAHNPIERYERKPGFCFAGSYYLRYPVRQRDFDALLQAVETLGPVDIYDRNHGKDHPNYLFPEKYHRHIVGNLPFDQIEVAYKGYEFGININTVKHSQSMFARRVFDLLASNTTTVSNYSRGLRLMFGDLVVSSDDSNQLIKALRPLIDDAGIRRKHRLAGLRKVLREHTYQHRLSYVLEKVYGRPMRIAEPHMMVLAKADSEEALERLLGNFHRQTWHHKELLLCFEAGFRPLRSPVGDDVRVLSAIQANTRRVAGKGYVAGFHSDDYYGPNYLTDLALAANYSPAPFIGKSSHYRMDIDGPVLVPGEAPYSLGGDVARRRSVVLAELVDDTVADWIAGIENAVSSCDTLVLDEFNYCAGAGGVAHCPAVDDLKGLDVGMSIGALRAIADRIGPEACDSAEVVRDESAGLPGIQAAQLYEALGTPANKHLALTLSGNGLVLRSTLPPGQHAYAYLAGRWLPRQLQFSDIARLQLVSSGPDGLGLVLVFYDAAGEKISHALLKAGVNLTVNVPPGTTGVQIGLRASAAGDFTIQRLVFDHVPLRVDRLVTRARHLLVAKNYPSYDDLYKHAFVHRRVVEYHRQGIDVDVFRIGADGLSFYEFDGIDVTYGQAEHLRALLASGAYDSVMAHVVDERTWSVLQEFKDKIRIYIWAHGSEMQSAQRRECDLFDEATRKRAVALGDRRMAFWRGIFEEAHPNVKLVFVSSWFAHDVMDDVGVQLPQHSYEVIHNFVDNGLFRYEPKPAAQRRRILSIRPFTSNVYGNDLTVKAILALSSREFFEGLEFRIIGDGPLFERMVEPLRRFSNVVIEKRFLAQREIAELHRSYGVFLVPSRMDSQGVSRDEAMASGLVAVTNRVAAIPEFVDDSCAILCDAEDDLGLADAIERLYRNPELFLKLSAEGASRVRRQSGYAQTISREIALFAASAAASQIRQSPPPI